MNEISQVTNLTPDALDADNPFKWEVTTFSGAWLPGESAGGCRNYIDTFADNPQVTGLSPKIFSWNRFKYFCKQMI